jgi:hypothetical protein
MFNFEYEIELNDEGRPFINPVGATTKEMSFVEHKFMGMELARYIVGSTINLHLEKGDKFPLPEGELERLQYLESEITRISDIYAANIRDQFELLGIADRLLNKNFDLTVLNIAERDALNYNGIIFDDRIYKRQEGLKVKLIQTGQIFELKGGIDNEHWTEIKD